MASSNVTYITIPAGATGLSASYNFFGKEIESIDMPTGWVAADLSFKAGASATDNKDLYDDNDAEVVVQAAASRSIYLSDAHKAALKSHNYLTFRSGVTALAVNQTATRTLAVKWKKSA